MNASALAARFVSGPHVTASSNAEQRLRDWLAELEPQQAAEIGAWLHRPFARAILLGIVEFSPYLFDLIRADAARLRAAMVSIRGAALKPPFTRSASMVRGS